MKRKRFSKEFKLEALGLLECSDKSGAELARKLGVRRNQLSIRSIKDLSEDLSANINQRNPIQNIFFSRLFTVMPENSCTVRASS